MPYTLLLADDSVTIQRVIELTFADEDVTVVAVSDGDQAIERLEASPPDIVLADIGMPGKNGYEVAQYIRQSPRLAHIPVVLLTGAFEPVDQARANEAGCDGVLAKPFEPQLVISRVKELLARARRDPAAPSSERPAGLNADFQLPPLSPVAEPPTAAAATGPAARTELNDYFDRLDVAFSTLSSNAPAPAPLIAEPARTAIDTDIDWFGTQSAEGASAEPWDLPAPPPDTEPVDLPLSDAPPQPEAWFAPLEEVAAPDAQASLAQPEPAAEPGTPPSPEAQVAPVPAAPVEDLAPVASSVPALELPLPNPPPLPALADAFAALLAAEQGEPRSSAAVIWPASVPPAAALRDELVDEVTRRVLDRLSDTKVREAVADIASHIAERLIREEIERLKASIK